MQMKVMSCCDRFAQRRHCRMQRVLCVLLGGPSCVSVRYGDARRRLSEAPSSFASLPRLASFVLTRSDFAWSDCGSIGGMFAWDVCYGVNIVCE